jgi:hypothetical protein
MKDCSACGKRLDDTEFYRNKASNDGLMSRCKSCTKAYNAARKAKLDAHRPPGWKQKTKDKKAYSKEWRAAHPGYGTARKRDWWNKNKDRLKVRNTVRYAMKAGKLVRQPCVICGEPKTHGHHTDYSKPLDVVWLCQPHHVEVHKGTLLLP